MSAGSSPDAVPPARRPAAFFRRSGAFAALYHRSFRLFFYGQVVSLVGTWIQQVALSWLVLTLTNSALYVGLVNALDALPVLLLSLFVGVVVDRMSRHKLIVASQVTAMALSLVLGTLALTGSVRIGYVMVIATLYGVVNAFDIPARHTFYGDLVGREDLISAIALNSVSFNASRIVGPVIAGIILGTAGAGVCFLINGVSYLAVLWGLFRMDVPPFQRPAIATGSALDNVTLGLRHIARDARMRALVILIGILTIFGTPFLVLLPIVAKLVLGRGAGAYGWMMSAVGIGALLGALAIASVSRRVPRGRIVAWSSAVFGLLIMALAAAHNLGIILPLLAMIGFAMIINGAIANALLQTLAPDHLRGRVVSVYTLVAVGFAPLGAVQAGAIAERFGAPVALATGGLLCVIGSVMALARAPELRETR